MIKAIDSNYCIGDFVQLMPYTDACQLIMSTDEILLLKVGNKVLVNKYTNHPNRYLFPYSDKEKNSINSYSNNYNQLFEYNKLYSISERRQSLRSFVFGNTLYEVINMLTIRKENFREDEINVILDGLVPKNHLVRKIENAIDFSFIYDKVKDLYSPLGAPSIDPVVLIKIVLIQYLFGIPSMRQTIREIEVNVAYRWFLGYSLTEKIPHFSTFNKNYERRFKNTDLFESIFKEILARATKCGFVDSSNIYIDSTHIKASANKKKYTKVEVDIQAKHYQEKLEKEINEDRVKHGKSPLCEAKIKEVKKKKK